MCHERTGYHIILVHVWVALMCCRYKMIIDKFCWHGRGRRSQKELTEAILLTRGAEVSNQMLS